jgi:hypothetical protein
MSNRSLFLLGILCLIWTVPVQAQSLLDEVEQELGQPKSYTQATFKTTVLALGQSVQVRKEGTLEFSWNSRFWNLPERTQGFVADRMSSRFGLNYAFSNRFTAGFGITTFDGYKDGYFKWQIARQGAQGKGMPFTITLFQNAGLRDSDRPSVYIGDSFSEKLSFTSQMLIARKFTRNFSLQLSPTFVFRNETSAPNDPSRQFALGMGGRYRVGGHVSITSEYYYQADPLNSVQTFDSFALGVNWELTDLMLQFILTNTPFMAEDGFITQTRNNFNTRDGNLYFGFNATLVLHLKKQTAKK